MEIPDWVPIDAKPLDGYPPVYMGAHTPRAVCEGGIGFVYFCEFNGNPDSRCVVKQLRPEIVLLPRAAENFVRECRIWLSLGDHPNIVRVQSVHMVPAEAPTVTAEFLPKSLRQHLREQPRLAAAELVGLGQDLVAGLIHARKRVPGFIHGDLKPENVMLDHDGTALISDFGHARSIGSTIPTGTTEAQSIRATASAIPILGTPLYMAPEMIRGSIVEASDVYALGCILHEAATGRPTYGTPDSVEDYLQRHLYQTPIDITGNLPPHLASLIIKCLHKEPDLRPTLSEMEQILGSTRRSKQEEHNPNTRQRIQDAISFRNIGMLAEAKNLLAPIAEGDRADKDGNLARIILASCYNTETNSRAAEALLDRVERSTLEPVHNAIYLLERARVASDSRSPNGHSQAIAYLTQAIDIKPDNSVLWFNRAIARDRAGDRHKAMQDLSRALTLSPNLAYFEKMTMWCIENGSSNFAKAALYTANCSVESHPENPTAYALRALARTYALLHNIDQVNETALLPLLDDFDVARKGGVSIDKLKPIEELMQALFRKSGYAVIDGSM